MVWKAVLFDFNGVVINDEPLHRQLLDEILLMENLQPMVGDEFRRVCLGRGDRLCLRDLLHRRGREVSDAYLTKLVDQKSQLYQAQLQGWKRLPLYADTLRCLAQVRSLGMPVALVTGALSSEVAQVLAQGELTDGFDLWVTGDEVERSKPDPQGYHWAVERLRQKYPHLQLMSENCLAIEDTLAGIQAAKAAHIPVVGVAHTYPLHLLQRWANWAVDSLDDLDFAYLQRIFQGIGSAPEATL